MKTVLWKSTIAGGIIAFIWSIFSWSVIGWPSKVFSTFADESKVAQVITENSPSSGVYLLPNSYNNGPNKCEKRVVRLLKTGPIVFATVQKEGMNEKDIYKALTISFIGSLLTAYFLSWAVSKTRALLYFQRVVFITIMGGVVVCLYGILPNYLWKGFPLNYTLISMADTIVSWFLAALVMVSFMNLDKQPSK